MSAAQAQSLPERLPSLDGLRGLAILLVLVHQFGDLRVAGGVVNFVADKVIYLGWTGVQLFFVLSGFLITGILLDTQRATNHLSGFFARRILRIFPLYFGVLAVAFLLLPFLGVQYRGVEADRANQVWLWTYLSNFAGPLGFGSSTFPHFWSLAIEEQFYLVWPFLMWRATPERCLKTCLAVVLLAIASRAAMVGLGATREMIYQFTPSRMDALALGAAAAAAFRMAHLRALLLAHRDRLLVAALLVAVVGAVPTRAYSTGNAVGQIAGYTLVAAGYVLVLCFAVVCDLDASRGWRAWLRLRPLMAVGAVSYAMYIFHKPLHDLAGKQLAAAFGLNLHESVLANAVYVGAAGLVVYVAAWLSWHLFEKHLLRLKRHVSPRYP